MSSSNMREIYLRDLGYTQSSYYIKCQVIRITTVCDIYNGKPTAYFQIILIDSEDQKIEALIKVNTYYTKSFNVEPHRVYTFSNLTLLPNDGENRMTNHTNKILLTKESVITLVETACMTNLCLTPIPIQEISNMKETINYLIDTVGVITARSGPHDYWSNGSKVTRLLFEISDHT